MAKEKTSKKKKMPKNVAIDLKAKKARKKAKEKLKLKDAESLVSNFTDEYSKIRELVGHEEGDFKSEKASQAFLRASLVTVNGLIPLMEAACQEDPKQTNIYALNSLISQGREIMQDLSASHDMEQQVNYISEKIIGNALRLILQNISTELFTQRSQVSMVLESTPKKRKKVLSAIEDSLRRQAMYMKEVQAKIEEDLNNYLVG